MMTAFWSELSSFLALDFVKRALIVGALVSLCAALLGVSLVLKRYAMIGDGLSHVGFAVLAIAAGLGVTEWQLYISIPVMILAAFLLLRLNENSGVKGDAAIGVIATLALAIGYIVTYRAGTNVDLANFMFGNIFTIRHADAVGSIIVAVAVLLLFVLFYHKLFAVTFDETFARASGVPVGWYNTLLAVLTAVTIVLGMRMMGTLLISALIVFPALSAMRLCRSFRGVVITAAAFSLFCFFTGAVTAHLLNFPAGSTVVAVNGILFSICSVISLFRRRVK